MALYFNGYGKVSECEHALEVKVDADRTGERQWRLRRRRFDGRWAMSDWRPRRDQCRGGSSSGLNSCGLWTWMGVGVRDSCAYVCVC